MPGIAASESERRNRGAAGQGCRERNRQGAWELNCLFSFCVECENAAAFARQVAMAFGWNDRLLAACCKPCQLGRGTASQWIAPCPAGSCRFQRLKEGRLRCEDGSGCIYFLQASVVQCVGSFQGATGFQLIYREQSRKMISRLFVCVAAKVGGYAHGSMVHCTGAIRRHVYRGWIARIGMGGSLSYFL